MPQPHHRQDFAHLSLVQSGLPVLRRIAEPPQFGQGRALHWPGLGHGVRRPDLGETPLSMAEVTWGLRTGLIARTHCQPVTA